MTIIKYFVLNMSNVHLSKICVHRVTKMFIRGDSRGGEMVDNPKLCSRSKRVRTPVTLIMFTFGLMTLGKR